MRNHWVEHAELLATAYLENEALLCHAVVHRALQRHLTLAGHPAERPARVLDLGGGQAVQARALAQAGHSVTVLDLDERMLDAAQAALLTESETVQRRVRLVRGGGEDALALVGDGFDLACCHSVLMYLEDPQPLIEAMARCVRPAGLLSVLSLNTDALAMRAGLQGRWEETIARLRSGREAGAGYLPTQEPSRQQVCAWFAQHGVEPLAWYGVGVFTDHHEAPIRCEDPWQVVEAEWEAGTREPYRSVARCFHLLLQRPGASG